MHLQVFPKGWLHIQINSVTYWTPVHMKSEFNIILQADVIQEIHFVEIYLFIPFLGYKIQTFRHLGFLEQCDISHDISP